MSSRSLCLPFLYISSVSLSISCPLSPPLHFSVSFLSSRKTLVSGKRWSSCHFCFSHPPLPRAIVADPSFVCVLRLLLKIKNSPFHPLYCFLVGCPCHSLGFYVLAGYPSSFPLQRLAMLSAFSHFFFQRGINNFTETFIERLIAGISHGSVVVRKTLQRQTQVFGGVSRGLVTTRVFKRINLSKWVRVVCGKGGFFFFLAL